MLILGNILVGIGLSAATFGPVLGVILRVAPPEKQALAVGICSAGGSFGQFFIVPLAAILQSYFGDWRPTMWALTALAVLIIVLPIGLNDRKEIAAVQEGQRRRADDARGAVRGVRPAQLRAAGDRLLRLRLPCRLRRRPSAGLHLRQGHRAVAVRHRPVAGRAGRLGDRHGRSVQHRRRHPVELDGRPVQAQEPAVAALPAALAGVPGLRAGAAVGRVGADLRRRAGLPVARHRAAHDLAGRLHLRAGPCHHAERHRLLRPSGRQLLRRLGRRSAVRPAGQLRHDVVDLDRARHRLGRCCTGRSSRSGSRGQPRWCRSRHDPRAGTRCSCGVPPPWSSPRPPCRSSCGA